MESKKKSLTGREVRLEKGKADWRDQREQPQDNQLPDKFKAISTTTFDLDAYQRSIRRALVDVAVLIHDWPGGLRLNYYVDRNGCLRCTRERRTVK